MDVVFTLSSLLFEHDRVVVNGLGIFTTELQKAYVHPVEHSFTPEFKKIKFRADKTTKDDLLAKTIGQKDAGQLIAKFVENIHLGLKEGNKVQLKNIGFLYSHHTGEIILEQDNSFNYVKKNFGLNSFIQEPVNKIVASVEPAVVAAPVKQRKKPRVLLYLLWSAAIILAILAFWKMDTIKDFFNEVPGKNIAETKTEAKVTPKLAESDDNKDSESQTAIVDSKEDSTEAEVLTEDTLENTTSVNDVMEEEVAKVEVVQEEPKAEPVVEAKKTEGPQYYVIAGCFRSEFKANRLLNDLQSNGFENASIEGKTPNGLIRVCYATYPKRRQASNYMLKLQNQGRKGVWIQKGN